LKRKGKKTKWQGSKSIGKKKKGKKRRGGMHLSEGEEVGNGFPYDRLA